MGGVIFQDGAQGLIAEGLQKIHVVHHVEEAVNAHVSEVYGGDLLGLGHAGRGPGSAVGLAQVTDVRYGVADAYVDRLVIHPFSDPVGELLQDLSALGLGQGVHDNDEAAVVVEEVAVMGQASQKDLHAVGETAALHRIHPVQASGGHQGYLEGAVQIKVGPQFRFILFSVLGLFYGPDQGGADLLVRFGGQEDADAGVLDQVSQIDLPRDDEQGKIVLVAEGEDRGGDLLHIIAGIDQKSGGAALMKAFDQGHQGFFGLKAQTGGNGQLLAGEVLQDGHILHHEEPADGIGPAVSAGFQFDLISVFARYEHIFDGISHDASSFTVKYVFLL